MAKIKNLTTDDLGYRGEIFPAGETVEVSDTQAKAMSDSMPDRFRLVKRTRNRKVSDEATENRAVS